MIDEHILFVIIDVIMMSMEEAGYRLTQTIEDISEKTVLRVSGSSK